MVAGSKELAAAMAPVTRPRWSVLPAPPRRLRWPPPPPAGIAAVCFGYRRTVTHLSPPLQLY
ncbi:hypothetical protein [Oryza sativa Japonica Group]|uniref:Uncharacterized protein n=1 Tax=Oryza sativa subsp. japonica TaxID=39947 RepID=Q5VRY9_ORYSJ|nr:hypothetical protein [Oryza sativa Japonica Group]